MKKTFVYSSVVLALLAGSASAVDFSVDGSVQSFSKAGFNNQRLNSDRGIAPTDSFTTLFSQVNVNADLGAGFKLGLGGSMGGLVYDSTSSGRGAGDAYSVVQDAYFGVAWDKNGGNGRVQNYMIHNAFLEYSSSMFYLKAGRYESGNVGEWFSGYNQGAEAYVNAGPAKLWGFFSNRRAFAYDQWFNDYYVVNRDGSKSLPQNTYAVGLDLGFSGFTLSGFSYLVPEKVVAPGVSLTLDTNPAFEGQGFRSMTKIRTLFPMAQGEYKEGKSKNQGRDWGKIQNQAATLYIEQKFDLDNVNFGAGFYQNFGNANALIGTWGNPLMLDFWTATAYEYGRALSDMVGADATTGFGFFGMNHGSFDWKVIARGTSSKRSDEQSLALHLKYQVNEKLAMGGKLEWLNDTTKAGYHGYNESSILTNNRTDDRSHLFFFVSQSF